MPVDEPLYDYVERGTVERLRAELAAMTAERDRYQRWNDENNQLIKIVMRGNAEYARHIRVAEDAAEDAIDDRDEACRQTARLTEAFIKHRTATHEVTPKFCKTCQESDAALAQPGDRRAGDAG